MFWEKYVHLCSNIGESPNAVAKKLNISSGTVTGWKQGAAPQNKKIKQIANYFGVSVDYLLGGTDKKEGANITAKEKSTVIIMDYHGDGQEVIEVSKEDEEMIKAIVKNLKDKYNK